MDHTVVLENDLLEVTVRVSAANIPFRHAATSVEVVEKHGVKRQAAECGLYIEFTVKCSVDPPKLTGFGFHGLLDFSNDCWRSVREKLTGRLFH